MPDKNRRYYVHVDLAYKHDRAVVAMASVEDWATIKYSETVKHKAPIIKVDAVRYWTPRPDQNIDFEEIKQFIVNLKMAGFPLRLVTFDQWNSAGYRDQLQRDFGIKTDLLSVAKPHYEDFSLAIAEQRVRGYGLPLLVNELLGLRVIKGNKIDHQRKTSKDLSDAVVGAVYNVVLHEKQMDEVEIEVFFGDLEGDQEVKEAPREEYTPLPSKPKKMPKSLASFISSRQEPDDEPEVKPSYSSLLEQEVELQMYMDGKQVI